MAEGLVARGLYERRDDVCAVAYTYCSDCQTVPRPGHVLGLDSDAPVVRQ